MGYLRPPIKKSEPQDVQFTEYKEASTFDLLKLAFQKSKSTDLIAYVLMFCLLSWVVFCWVNATNPYYTRNWKFSDDNSWGQFLAFPMDLTRGVSALGVIGGSLYYIMFWFLNRNDE